MSRRSGGRAARQAIRQAPLADDIKPVQPGMNGGAYKPLAENDLDKINEAVMEILATIGMAQATPSAIEYLTGAGCEMTSEGRLLFPRSLVEDTIANAARNFTLHGQDPKHDMELTGSRTYFGTAGAAVHVVDVDTREYRESQLEDLFHIGRIVELCEHIHFFQRPLVARDMVEPADLDFNTCYASLVSTTKHIGTSWVDPEHVRQSLEMLHMVAGSEEKWRERPFMSMSCTFVVPPLRFAEDSINCMEVGVKGGMPVLLLSAGQAGATSPAAIAGSVAQAVAECLAGLVYVNAIVPGHPAMFGTWPFVSDLRTGAMSGGSGEQAVLAAASGQMGRYYDLPCGTAAGMTDAKLPDAQSGYEKGYTDTLAGHCGVNLVYESAGMHGSLMGCCYESYVIDNDMLGAINRTIRGIEVNDETLSLEAMRNVCLGGPNHYLGHDQTINLMQREYIYPELGDRTSPKEWKEQGSTDMLERAKDRVKSILENHYPNHISKELDDAIREKFDVKLPREIMQP
ncbi:MAG: trimethylamine methyltransferase family protein [Pseudomonadota bacterium]